MFRRPFGSERIQRVDQQTGIQVIQLTSYPSPSIHFSYNWPSVTGDGERVMLLAQRGCSRGAPWDIFRCDADGLNLFQLTEHSPKTRGDTHYGYAAPPSAALSLDGSTIYAIWSGEDVLFGVDVESGELIEIADLSTHVSESANIGGVFPPEDGDRVYVGVSIYGEGEGGGFRVDLNTGNSESLSLGGALWGYIQSTDRLVTMKNFVTLGTKERENGVSGLTNLNDKPMTMYTVREDGTEENELCPYIFAHATVMGKTGFLQGTGQRKNRGVWTVDEDGAQRLVAQGPYFWHSGASWDGEWIVSDTNWPDEDLKLIHVPTGHYRTLCHAGATQDHTQLGHAHPALSCDGSLAVFASDRTGVPQVYVAHITDDFRESVIEGVLDHPLPKWL